MPAGSAFLMRQYRRSSGRWLWALGERVPFGERHRKRHGRPNRG